MNFGEPKFGNRMQLFSRTRHNLSVYYDDIRGTQDDNDIHSMQTINVFKSIPNDFINVLAHMEISGGGSVGHVRIQGMLTNMFVAMDKKGRLYPEVIIKKNRGLYQIKHLQLTAK